mmetsp:Transcript_9353/g.25414  ORF Transcript_9353/g.25414 Transcript_9353/m.25414 type:complete len:82 (-) Transcript_9353:78-323(-)
MRIAHRRSAAPLFLHPNMIKRAVPAGVTAAPPSQYVKVLVEYSITGGWIFVLSVAGLQRLLVGTRPRAVMMRYCNGPSRGG